MPTAYVLINCDVDHKKEVMNQLDQLPGIFETAELHGAYDILARFTMQSVEELKDTIKLHLKKYPISNLLLRSSQLKVPYKSHNLEDEKQVLTA